jgi:hypothetical protein
MSVARRCVHHLVNLVYRPTSPEGASKDDEFSRRSIEDRCRFSKRWRLKLGGSTAYVCCTCAACANANSWRGRLPKEVRIAFGLNSRLARPATSIKWQSG